MKLESLWLSIQFNGDFYFSIAKLVIQFFDLLPNLSHNAINNQEELYFHGFYGVVTNFVILQLKPYSGLYCRRINNDKTVLLMELLPWMEIK